jgi:hypothetical protein
VIAVVAVGWVQQTKPQRTPGHLTSGVGSHVRGSGAGLLLPQLATSSSSSAASKFKSAAAVAATAATAAATAAAKSSGYVCAVRCTHGASAARCPAAPHACQSGPNSSGPGSGMSAGWNAHRPGESPSLSPQRAHARASPVMPAITPRPSPPPVPGCSPSHVPAARPSHECAAVLGSGGRARNGLVAAVAAALVSCHRHHALRQADRHAADAAGWVQRTKPGTPGHDQSTTTECSSGEGAPTGGMGSRAAWRGSAWWAKGSW